MLRTEKEDARVQEKEKNYRTVANKPTALPAL
jgi:hypothetical protein